MTSGLVWLCGKLAPWAAIAVFAAPMPTIIQVSKEKSVGNLPLLPYSAMIANCSLWLCYGVLRGQPNVWGANLVGLMLAVFYFLKFVRFAPARSDTLPGSVRNHVNVIAGIMAAIFMLTFILPLQDPASVIGNVAVLFCVAMFGSPLAALQVVLLTKSAKSIPLPFTIATVLNCFLWSVFGLWEAHDVYIYLPNLAGLALGLVQVALKLSFGDGVHRLQDDLDLIT